MTSDWLTHHRASEALATQAHQALREGARAEAVKLFTQAAKEELAALNAAGPSKPRTFGITSVSAVSLFYKGKAFQAALKLAQDCLRYSELPGTARTQLEELERTITLELVPKKPASTRKAPSEARTASGRLRSPHRGTMWPALRYGEHQAASSGGFQSGSRLVAVERSGAAAGTGLQVSVGRVAGVVHGPGAPAMIELDHNALYLALKKEAFHSSILEMELNGATSQVLLRDVKMHPFQPMVLHVDFQRVDATTKITKAVPLRFVGEEESPAVKIDGGHVRRLITSLQITCLAKRLPEFLEVDLSPLASGQSIHVKDLALPQGVKVAVAAQPGTVVAVAEPKGHGDLGGRDAASGEATPENKTENKKKRQKRP